MENLSKKPPIEIKRVAAKEEVKQGPLGFTDDPPGGGGKKSNITPWLGGIIAVLLAAIMVVQYSPSKANLVSLSEDIAAISTQVSTFDSSLKSDRTRIDSIINSQGEYAKRSELDGYVSDSEVVDLLALPSEIDTKIAELEASSLTEEEIGVIIEGILGEVEEEEKAAEVEDTCRWELDIYITSTEHDHDKVVDVEWEVRPSRIEEEDDYRITVDLFSSRSTEITALQLEVYLRSKNNVKVFVEEDGIDLWGRDTYWYPEVDERKDGTCRKIVFESDDDIHVPAGTTEEPGEETLRLEFTLEYGN